MEGEVARFSFFHFPFIARETLSTLGREQTEGKLRQSTASKWRRGPGTFRKATYEAAIETDKQVRKGRLGLAYCGLITLAEHWREVINRMINREVMPSLLRRYATDDDSCLHVTTSAVCQGENIRD